MVVPLSLPKIVDRALSGPGVTLQQLNPNEWYWWLFFPLVDHGNWREAERDALWSIG
jgi:hypothetical protein